MRAAIVTARIGSGLSHLAVSFNLKNMAATAPLHRLVVVASSEAFLVGKSRLSYIYLVPLFYVLNTYHGSDHVNTFP